MTENFSELTFEQIKIDQTKEFQIKITESLVDELEEKFKRLNHVDRCINNSGKVIYMHLGRGIVKSEKKYYKSGRTTLKEWISWYNKEILCQ